MRSSADLAVSTLIDDYYCYTFSIILLLLLLLSSLSSSLWWIIRVYRLQFVPVIRWSYYNTNIPQSRCSSRRRRRRYHLSLYNSYYRYYIIMFRSNPADTYFLRDRGDPSFARPTNTRSRRAFVVIECTFFSSFPLYLPHTSRILLLFIKCAHTYIIAHVRKRSSSLLL